MKMSLFIFIIVQCFSQITLAEGYFYEPVSLQIPRCQSNEVRIDGRTSLAYLQSVERERKAGNHCTAVILFGVLMTNMKDLEINHTPNQLAQGFLNALKSSIEGDLADADIRKWTENWIDIYLATMPSLDLLPEILESSVTFQAATFAGCDRNQEPIEKTLRETYVFETVMGYALAVNSEDNNIENWKSSWNKIQPIQNQMRSCFAAKHFSVAEYYFLPKSKRGIISYLFSSPAERERSPLAAGERLLTVLRGFRDLPKVGDLAMLRLAELPQKFSRKGYNYNIDWVKRGQEALQLPLVKIDVTERSNAILTVIQSKTQLALAHQSVKQGDFKTASDALYNLILNFSANRYTQEGTDLLRELQSKGLVSNRWIDQAAITLKVSFSSEKYDIAKIRLLGIMESISDKTLFSATSEDLKILLSIVAKEKDRLSELKREIPKDLLETESLINELSGILQ